MTNQEILALLQRIDNGYCATSEERNNLSLVEEVTFVKIAEVPNSVELLTNLRQLTVKNTSISKLPETIRHLTKLKKLNLSNTKIKELPKVLCSLLDLDTLDLGATQISELPNWIDHMQSLQTLYLYNTQIKTLPEAICCIKNLQSLYLGRSQISELPSSIQMLSNLQLIDLRNSLICRLPKTIGALKSLRFLYIGRNQISELPITIGDLINLQELDLRNAQIEDLPESIGDLQNLKILNLHNSKIRSLPDTVSKLYKLQDLDLSDSQISSLPESIGCLQNLYSINLSNTCIRNLPETIGNLYSLVSLKLNNTQIEGLPITIGNLQNLKHLYLAYSQIIRLPETIGNLKKLEQLDIHVTPLTRLPVSIGKIISLNSLDLYNTRLILIPPSIGDLIGLKKLNLGRTKISSLPESIIRLKNLENLNLRQSAINKLPEDIDNLTCLKNLNLDSTSIKELPECIGNLSALEYLDLRKTYLNKLPASIGELSNLKILILEKSALPELPECLLDLSLNFVNKPYQNRYSKGIYIDGLKLRKQPVSLFIQPNKFIVDYYKQPHIDVNETKVIFIGSEGVGKTHTLKRILNNNHKINERLQETPGISITSKDFITEKLAYRINFWDFGGQAIMHAMHRCFLTNRTSYIIVVSTRYGDVTEQARMWLRNLQSFANDALAVILVNIWSDGTYYGIDENTLRCEFQNIEAIVQCSVKESESEEFAAVTTAIQRLAEKNDSISLQFPKKWENIRQSVISCGKHEYYIDTETYKKICEENGVENAAIQGWLLDWFNDLGECFTYQTGKDMFSGNQYSMILNPEWLTNAIYLIIRELGEGAKQGVVAHKRIKKLLERSNKGTIQGVKYTFDECEYILQVMRRYRLSYKIPGKEYEFIPSLLCNRPDNLIVPPGITSCKYEMRYRFLPENVLQELMVEYYSLINEDNCWRNSFSIDIKKIGYTESSIFISSEYGKQSILIQIEQYIAKETGELLQSIRDKILEINERLNLQARDYIIVNSKDENDEQESISLKRLLRLKERKITHYEAYEKSYIIDELLGRTYGAIVVEEAEQESEADNNVFDRIIELLGKRDAKSLLGEKIKELISIDDIYDYIMVACIQIQGRSIFWSRPEHVVSENARNDELRDLLSNRELYIRDQTHVGHGEKSVNPGLVDLAIIKSEKNPVPLTLIEAMNLSGVNTNYIKKHLDKLVDGYNASGLRELFLVSYVELAKETFPSFWKRYKEKVKKLNGNNFTVDIDVIPEINESRAWIKSIKMTYNYAGEKLNVYHICARVAE